MPGIDLLLTQVREYTGCYTVLYKYAQPPICFTGNAAVFLNGNKPAFTSRKISAF